mgnify:CR=1 FL=1
MSNDLSHTRIVSYKTYFVVLIFLLLMTSISVLITQIELGKLALAGAIFLAAIKSSLVLWFFMHLKFEVRTIKLMIALVLIIYASVLIATVLDFVLME